MGRETIPTNLKLIKGTARADRIKDEPNPEPSIPSPPEFLDQVASVEWGRVSHQLFSLGLLSDLDRAVLAGYCQYYSKWKRAEEELRKTGELLKTTNGNIIQNPWVGICNQAYQLMSKAAQEFGMTPSARARVSVRKAEAEKTDGFSKFKKKG